MHSIVLNGMDFKLQEVGFWNKKSKPNKIIVNGTYGNYGKWNKNNKIII